jgi:cell division protein FtsB
MVRPQRAAWLYRVAVAFALALALGWLPWQVYSRSGLAHLLKLRGELASLRAENASLRAANDRLRADVLLYEEDPLAAIERAAREELGLVKPGEIVFRLDGVKAEP